MQSRTDLDVPAAADASVPATLPPFATKAVLLIAAAVAIVQGVCSRSSGYMFDEAYMLAIGRHHLDWGSADQPPVAPLLATLMDTLVPGSIVALRLPAVLATVAAVLVAAAIARELGGDRRAQVLTAGAQATALWITMAGHWLTPYALEPVQWLLLAWLLVRWMRVRDDRLLLALGVVAGIAVQTKFQVLLLCAVVGVGVLLFGPRALFRRPMLWVGMGIAALIALPTMLWQASNGWPQLQMSSVLAAEAGPLYGGRVGIAITLLVMGGVAGTVLALYGVWRLLRADELRAYRFLGLAAVLLYVFFVATQGRPYYLDGVYAILVAFGALGLQRRRELGRKRWSWVAWPAYVLSAAAAAGVLVAGSSMQDDAIPTEVVGRVASAYHDLPAERRDDTVLMGQSYIYAAYLDLYSERYELPHAYSSNRSYGYFPPPPESARNVLYVGSDPAELEGHFAEIRQVADGGEDASVWLCTDRTASWEHVWPQLRNLFVS